jgi:hypothetical protein
VAWKLTFAVVLLNTQLGFHIGVDKLVHINNVVGTFVTRRRTRRGGAELEVNKTGGRDDELENG